MTSLASSASLRARAVALAASWVGEGRRLEMQALADELGVARATLFRNAGTREVLLGEALWQVTEQMLHAAQRRWEAERPARALHTTGTGRHINALVSSSAALHQLLGDEPALTIRVLTNPLGPVQTGVVAFIADLLRQDMEELGYQPIIEPDTLAFALVRMGESFLYADVLAARPPDVATANRLQEALVEGVSPPSRIG